MRFVKALCLLLAAIMLTSAFTACNPTQQDGTTAASDGNNSTADTQGQTDGETTGDTAAIPDENLSGMNTDANPSEHDGDGAALLADLQKIEIIKQSEATANDTVDRGSYAYDIAYCGGFLMLQAIYVCENDYTDMEAYSAEMRRAEIAVNQGFMLKPDTTEFKPNDPITYGEVLRGFLYVLGYREYADSVGVAKLSAEIGLSNYIDLAKKNSSTVTYAELAQVASNALELQLVQCVEKDGAYSVCKREGDFNIYDTYIKKSDDESATLFRLANTGWDYYPGGGYRYGPSIIINDDGTIDVWTASNSGVGGEVDWGKYRRSYDNGVSWTTDTGAVRPTSAAEDWNWSCDPGLVKIGDYYYSAYTTILWHDGVDNNMFIARSKTPQGAFVEKWCGDGWTGNPKAAVTYDGVKSAWGAGEGSMVVVDNTVYLYVTWDAPSCGYTRVYTAPADDPNWPGKLTYRGSMLKKDGSEDSCDVKYIDAYNCFIAVATASRFSASCYIHIWISYDGIFFRHEGVIKHQTEGSNFLVNAHNMGISGDQSGHIDIFRQQYVGYAYQPDGFSWANWPTRFVPLTWLGTELYGNESRVEDNDGKAAKSDKTNTPSILEIRAYAKGDRTVQVKNKDNYYLFSVAIMTKSGNEKQATKAQYAELEYIYDSSKVEIDKENHKVKLLVDEVVRVYIKYGDVMCEFAVAPYYLDLTAPVEFYPETDEVVFLFRNEIKQPAFIARSEVNTYLMLWGDLSSYTDTRSTDIPTYIRKWDQKVVYSGYDESIISVNQSNGQITAVAVGETTITATYMGMTATIKVRVEKLK